MSRLKWLITLVWCIASPYLHAQENELLFLRHQYEDIIQNCTPPTTENDYFWLAQSLDQQGQYLKAIAYLEAYNDTNRLSPINTLKADLHFKTGQYNKALPYYLASKHNANSFLRVMKILEFNGEYNATIAEITDRLKNDSTNIELLSILANSYYRCDASIMAIRTYERIHVLNPNDLSSANKLALLLLNSRKEGNVRKSIDIANTVLEKDSTNKRFLRIKGRGHYISNDYHRALPCFKSLYDGGYNNLSNCKHLGICEFKIGAYDSARIHLLEAYVIEPSDLQTNLFVGKAFLESDQIFGALLYFKNVDTLLLPTDEMMTSLLWDKQRCYRALESYTKVDTLLHELMIYDKKSDYYFYIASNYESGLKDKKKALVYYEKFMTASGTPQEIKKTKDLRAIAQQRMDKLKEDDFWEEK